jgi:prepilin-type N-terminal cleavage/methylation domain-containing protein
LRASQDGYTLLELLVGITLLGLLMAALVVGIHVGNKAWQQGEARMRKVHVEEERTQFMSAQISSLMPYKVLSQNPELPGEFAVLEASATHLRFLSTMGSHFRNRAGLLLDEYAIVRTSARDFSLVLREIPVHDDGSLLRQLIERVDRDPETGKAVITFRPFSMQDSDLRLMTGLQMVRFEYFGSQTVGKEPTWTSNWQGGPEAPYPEAIRFIWQQADQRHQAVFPLRAHSFRK